MKNSSGKKENEMAKSINAGEPSIHSSNNKKTRENGEDDANKNDPPGKQEEIKTNDEHTDQNKRKRSNWNGDYEGYSWP